MTILFIYSPATLNNGNSLPEWTLINFGNRRTYEGGSKGMRFLNFPPFSLKSNTASAKLQLVSAKFWENYTWQSLKADMYANFGGNICCENIPTFKPRISFINTLETLHITFNCKKMVYGISLWSYK